MRKWVNKENLAYIVAFLACVLIGYFLPAVPLVGHKSDVCQNGLLVYKTSGQICGYVRAYLDDGIILFPSSECRCYFIPRSTNAVWEVR